MTLMIPNQMGPKTPNSEKNFFRELRDDPKTDHWIALHSLNLVRHKTQAEGECDMVVLIPDHGVLVVEIKGVGVRRIDGMFHYDDGRRPDHGPFKQAASARWSLLESLRKRDPAFGKLLFWSVVIFPTVPFKENSDEWHSWQCINSDDIKSRTYSDLLVGVVENAHKFMGSLSSQVWYDPLLSRPTSDLCLRLKDALRRDFNYVSSPSILLDQAETEIKRFTDQQLDVVDSIAVNRRSIVRGPAGTGKTLIASEVFRAKAEAGLDVLFVCYNKNLAYYLQVSLQEVIDTASGSCRISTFHSVLTDYVSIPDEPTASFWSKDLPQDFQEHFVEHNLEPIYDYVIIDESQDLMSEDYLEALDFIVKGGLHNGSWTLFGDFDNQNIYSAMGDRDLGTLGKLSSKNIQFSTHFVKKNCRNSRKIVGWLETMVEIQPKYTDRLPDNEMASISFKWWSSLPQQAMLLEGVIDEVLKDFKPNDIVILSPKSKTPIIQNCSQRIRNKCAEIGSQKQEDKNKIRISSIHAFKGLERQLVILTDIENFSDEEKALFYVGLSRAKLSAVVLIHEKNKNVLRALARS